MTDFDHDIISRYLDGEMEAEEKKAFEEMLQQNKALQQEVELHRYYPSSKLPWPLSRGAVSLLFTEIRIALPLFFLKNWRH